MLNKDEEKFYNKLDKFNKDYKTLKSKRNSILGLILLISLFIFVLSVFFKVNNEKNFFIDNVLVTADREKNTVYEIKSGTEFFVDMNKNMTDTANMKKNFYGYKKNSIFMLKENSKIKLNSGSSIYIKCVNNQDNVVIKDEKHESEPYFIATEDTELKLKEEVEFITTLPVRVRLLNSQNNSLLSQINMVGVTFFILMIIPITIYILNCLVSCLLSRKLIKLKEFRIENSE